MDRMREGWDAAAETRGGGGIFSAFVEVVVPVVGPGSWPRHASSSVVLEAPAGCYYKLIAGAAAAGCASTDRRRGSCLQAADAKLFAVY